MQGSLFVTLLHSPRTYRQEVMVLLWSGPKPSTGKLLPQRIMKTGILVSLLNTPVKDLLLVLVYRCGNQG